jgi:hypothetical protein
LPVYGHLNYYPGNTVYDREQLPQILRIVRDVFPEDRHPEILTYCVLNAIKIRAVYLPELDQRVNKILDYIM